jgi:hypothetical protein
MVSSGGVANRRGNRRGRYPEPRTGSSVAGCWLSMGVALINKRPTPVNADMVNTDYLILLHLHKVAHFERISSVRVPVISKTTSRLKDGDIKCTDQRTRVSCTTETGCSRR